MHQATKPIKAKSKSNLLDETDKNGRNGNNNDGLVQHQVGEKLDYTC